DDVVTRAPEGPRLAVRQGTRTRRREAARRGTPRCADHVVRPREPEVKRRRFRAGGPWALAGRERLVELHRGGDEAVVVEPAHRGEPAREVREREAADLLPPGDWERADRRFRHEAEGALRADEQPSQVEARGRPGPG